MTKTQTNSFMLTEEETKEIEAYIKSKTMTTGEHMTKSSLYREAIFKYIRNGKPDNEQDSKQESLPITPTEDPTPEVNSDSIPSASNPFADLEF